MAHCDCCGTAVLDGCTETTVGDDWRLPRERSERVRVEFSRRWKGIRGELVAPWCCPMERDCIVLTCKEVSVNTGKLGEYNERM